MHTIFNTSLPVVLRRLPNGWKGTLEEAISEVNAGGRTTKVDPEVGILQDIVENIEDGFIPKNKLGKYLRKKGYEDYTLSDLRQRLAELKGEIFEETEETTETE